MYIKIFIHWYTTHDGNNKAVHDPFYNNTLVSHYQTHDRNHSLTVHIQPRIYFQLTSYN